jgi:hypothetical protein
MNVVEPNGSVLVGERLASVVGVLMRLQKSWLVAPVVFVMPMGMLIGVSTATVKLGTWVIAKTWPAARVGAQINSQLNKMQNAVAFVNAGRRPAPEHLRLSLRSNLSFISSISF